MRYGRAVTSKHDKDSFIAVIPETFSTDTSFGAMELFHPYGFASRPLDADTNGACGLLEMEDGSQGYCVLLNDGRVQAKLPEIKPGESFQYGVTGAFSRIGADGVISLFTTDDTKTTGRSVYLQVAPTGLTFSFPFGKMTFDANGFHVTHASGARLDMGALAAPAPLNVLSSYATLSAGMVHVEGSACHVGTAAGVTQPVALATAVLTLASAINGVLAALVEPGAYVSASPGSPAAPGPALIAAVTAANTALGVAATALPSVSSTATGAP